jgi:hypothetical protein
MMTSQLHEAQKVAAMRFYRFLPLLTLVTSVLSTTTAPRAETSVETPPLPRESRQVVGYTETVRLFPSDMPLRAKIDTGARTSSLHAQDITIFAKRGRMWVRFHVTNRENRTQEFERPVVRRVRIKDLGGPSVSRPVVLMGICLGKVYRITEVNLSDRSGFNFQLLVGRRFMSQVIVVDPARQFTLKPKCEVPNDGLAALDAALGLPASELTSD